MSDTDQKNRKIIHVDMDCFYAQVEVKDNPSLRGKPIGVGGNAGGRGVLTTASYEARKFGVRSAMPTHRALRLCPDLILVPVHFERYKQESQKIRQVFNRFTDRVEPLSLDEAYLEVSHHPSATIVAQEIRRQIFTDTQLTASAGIAPNKFLAKVASDWRKPNGQFTIAPHAVSDFVKGLKVEKIPGVGKVTAKKMHGMGIYTCKDLQQRSLPELKSRFGSWGIRLYDICRGQDHREVESRGQRKSLSVESTYSQDLASLTECVKKIPELYDELCRRLDKANLHDKIQTLVVKVKFFDFTQTTLERGNKKQPDLDAYTAMIEKAYCRGSKPVRLLGLGVKIKSEKLRPDSEQMDLLAIEPRTSP